MTSYSVQLAAATVAAEGKEFPSSDDGQITLGMWGQFRKRGSDERRNRQWARTVLRNLHCNGPDDLCTGDFLEGTKLGCVAGLV